MSAGREWYIHTIYTVRSRENSNRGIGKRSLEFHSLVRGGGDPGPIGGPRSKRSTNEAEGVAAEIGEGNNRGTNILHVSLDRSQRRGGGPSRGEGPPEGVIPRELNTRDGAGDDGAVTIASILVGVLLAILVVILAVLLACSKQRKRRKKKEQAPKASGSTEPMVTMATGYHSNDSSEV